MSSANPNISLSPQSINRRNIAHLMMEPSENWTSLERMTVRLTVDAHVPFESLHLRDHAHQLGPGIPVGRLQSKFLKRCTKVRNSRHCHDLLSIDTYTVLLLLMLLRRTKSIYWLH